MSSYASSRAARHAAQDLAWTTIQQLPIRARAGSLFSLWPHKLPKRVRRKMDAELLAQWRDLRRQDQDRKMEEFREHLDDLMVEIESKHAQNFLISKHAAAIDDILKVCAALPNINEFVFLTPQGNYILEAPKKDDDEEMQNLAHHHIKLGLAVCLDQHTAGVSIRQVSHLRTQIINELGQKEWVAQEKVYGLFCSHGQWEALSDSEVRHSYTHDEEGNVIDHKDPLTTFGNLKDHVRKVLGSARRSP